MSTRRLSSLAAAAALALAAALAPLTAHAVFPTDPPVRPSTSGHCALQRVGDQFVRCDTFTGAGQPAPSWIPVRHPVPAPPEGCS